MDIDDIKGGVWCHGAYLGGGGETNSEELSTESKDINIFETLFCLSLLLLLLRMAKPCSYILDSYTGCKGCV